MQESSLTEQEWAALTPGGRLRTAREQLALSIAEVAETLRLTEAYIQALEDDHYETLPAEPFVLGYLRAYARLLELDAQPLVDCYYDYGRALLATEGHLQAALEPQPADQPVLNKASMPAPASVVTKPSQVPSPAVTKGEAAPVRSSRGYGWLILALGLLLWIASSLMMNSDESASATGVAPEAVTAVESGNSEPANPESANPESENPELIPAATGTVVAGPSTAEAETAAATVKSVTAETQSSDSLVLSEVESKKAVAVVEAAATEPLTEPSLAGLDRLQLAFTDECWLEVTDSRGDVLAADLYQTGDAKTLYGKPPFEVMIGNVRALSARFNDQALALNPDGFRKTLRLRIISATDIEILTRKRAQ